VVSYKKVTPEIRGAFVASSATVVGKVSLLDWGVGVGLLKYVVSHLLLSFFLYHGIFR
jgi:hypothetical protein